MQGCKMPDSLHDSSLMLFKDDDSEDMGKTRPFTQDKGDGQVVLKEVRINSIENLERKHNKSTVGLSQNDSNKLSVSCNSKNIQDKYLEKLEKTASHGQEIIQAPERSTNSDSSLMEQPLSSSASKVIEDMYREKLEKFKKAQAEKSANENQSSMPKLGKRDY